MEYTGAYTSPLGELLLACGETGLTGIWFVGGKFFARGLDPAHEERETPVLACARRWLDIYFSGREPDFMPPLHPSGTAFQRQVWALLEEIPYGRTATYRDLAEKIAAAQGLERMSAQAVGGAVGRNPISILIPCHRVVGSDGGLTGYAGGLDRKAALLVREGVEPERLARAAGQARGRKKVSSFSSNSRCQTAGIIV